MRDDRTRCRTGQGVESPPSSATDRSSGSTTSAHFTHTAMPVLVARAFVQTRLTRLCRARSILKIVLSPKRLAKTTVRSPVPGGGKYTRWYEGYSSCSANCIEIRSFSWYHLALSVTATKYARGNPGSSLNLPPPRAARRRQLCCLVVLSLTERNGELVRCFPRLFGSVFGSV